MKTTKLMKITKLLIIIALFSAQYARAGATFGSFSGTRVGNELQFKWYTTSENNMYYYEVMQVITITGYEKMMVHVDVTNQTQTAGVSYSANISMQRALLLGAFSGIGLLLLLGVLVGANKTIKRLVIMILCIIVLNVSCTKSSTPYTSGAPGISTSTQGVFRVKAVDLAGNVSNSDYIVIKY